MPRLSVKPGLMALREMIMGLVKAPERKLMDDDVEALMRRAQTGDHQALQTLQSQSQYPTVGESSQLPAVQEPNQRDLVSSLGQIDMNRRGFLRNLGGAGARMMMPSSPLELLKPPPVHFINEIQSLRGHKQHLELDPMELMRHSQKFMSQPLDLHKWPSSPSVPRYAQMGQAIRFADAFDLDHTDPFQEPINLSHAFKKNHNLTEEEQGHILKLMDLESTPQNIQSFEHAADATDFFDPDSIDAQYDDLKHSAQDYASGDWTTVDQFLEEKAKELGTTTDKLMEELEQFLAKVHGGEDQSYETIPGLTARDVVDTHLSARASLDEAVIDNAHDHGYMVEVMENLIELKQTDPKAYQEELVRLRSHGTPEQIDSVVDEHAMDKVGLEEWVKQGREVKPGQVAGNADPDTTGRIDDRRRLDQNVKKVANSPYVDRPNLIDTHSPDQVKRNLGEETFGNLVAKNPQSLINRRQDLDMRVEDHAVDRGFMDNDYQDDLAGVPEHPDMPKVLAEFAKNPLLVKKIEEFDDEDDGINHVADILKLDPYTVGRVYRKYVNDPDFQGLE